MKNFLIRLAIYIPIISFFWWIFAPGIFAPQDFSGPLVAQVVSYTAMYGVCYGFWIAAYELCYRAARAFSGDRPKPAPDTQPLSAIEQASNPTRPIDHIIAWNDRHGPTTPTSHL